MVTLDNLKTHLNIESSIDDAYLSSLLVVAENAVRKNLNIPDDGGTSATADQAILLLAGTLYNNRESVAYTSVNKVPHTFDYLISLDKNYDDANGR